ncbi:MAG: saccharopine dehydrogenase, partial [Acidobacteriota bacterium]
ETRMVDFGRGPVEAMLFPWGDVFTAFYSTGIPNISDYIVLPPAVVARLGMLRRLGPLLKFGLVRRMMQSQVSPGPNPALRAATRVDVWGQVEDDAGGRATARLHGPEAGVEWTALAALAVVRRVLAGEAPEGYQTPARAYGADLVMECEGVTREDVD